MSGWGILEEGGNSQPDILQEVEVETMSNNEVHQPQLLDTQLIGNILQCITSHNYGYKEILNNMLCAGGDSPKYLLDMIMVTRFRRGGHGRVSG